MKINWVMISVISEKERDLESDINVKNHLRGVPKKKRKSTH